jgi:hypothetical protein
LGSVGCPGGEIMPRQRKFWFLVAFAVIAIASGLILIYPSLEKEHIKSRILEHLQQTFDDIPVLAEAQLYRKLRMAL